MVNRRHIHASPPMRLLGVTDDRYSVAVTFLVYEKLQHSELSLRTPGRSPRGDATMSS